MSPACENILQVSRVKATRVAFWSLTHVGLSPIFEQNLKVDGFQRLIRQNVRGRSLFQKALLCFCISASLQAVKAIPTIGDFESVSGRR